MQINRSMLEEAVEKGLLDPDQAPALWDFLGQHTHSSPSFKAAHILYYLGGLIAIGAMTLFMTLSWERFGGLGLLLIALTYAAITIGVTEFLIGQQHLILPAGISASLTVVMTPLAIYGAQHLLGYWPAGSGAQSAYRDFHVLIDWRWLIMELATLAAGALALWRYRLPFLMLPVAVTLWYLSMDLIPFLFGTPRFELVSEHGRQVTLIFGLVMTLMAFWVDLRSRRSRDFAFWLYIFGMLTFSGALTSMPSTSELQRFLYGCLNVLFIAIGATLSRRVFALFGGIGLALYLGHLSYSVFKESMLFPLALSAIGFATIAAGIVWQRREARIGAALRARLPAPLRELLERRAW